MTTRADTIYVTGFRFSSDEPWRDTVFESLVEIEEWREFLLESTLALGEELEFLPVVEYRRVQNDE